MTGQETSGRETISLAELYEAGRITIEDGSEIPSWRKEGFLKYGSSCSVSPINIHLTLDEICENLFPSNPLDRIVIQGHYGFDSSGKVSVKMGITPYTLHSDVSSREPRQKITTIEFVEDTK